MVCPHETKRNEFIELDLKMKVAILAGGLGTRLKEKTHLKPKPMIEIGGRPILWHIMTFLIKKVGYER